MNAILTRSRQTHMSIWWEPFATSTPLKTVPKNLDLQRQLVLHPVSYNGVEKHQSGFIISNTLPKNTSSDSKHFLTKRVRKSASSDYFDILTTSSSDESESCESKKRPIIKLSTGKKTRSLLSINNLGGQRTDIVNKVNSSNKFRDNKKLKTAGDKHAFSMVRDLTPKISKPPSSKDQSQHQRQKLHSSFKNVSCSSVEENKISDQTKSYKRSARKIKLCLRSKENLVMSKKKRLKAVPEINDASKESKKGDTFEGLKGSVKNVSKDNSEATKTPGKGVQEVTSFTIPIKKCRKRKLQNKEEFLRPGSAGTPLHIWRKKHNLSHQLFSDSKEQEFINMLDLTREEIHETAEMTKYSAKEEDNDLLIKASVSPHPSVHNICNNKIKQQRPSRRKQIPKNFCLPEKGSDKPLLDVTTKEKKSGKKNNDHLQVQVLKNSNEANTSVSNLKSNKGAEHASLKWEKTNPKGKRKAGHTNKGKKFEPDKILTGNHIKQCDTTQNFLMSHVSQEIKEIEDGKSQQNVFPATTDGNAVNFKKPVFQKLSDLSYKNNETGCSVEQCWNLQSFKCGVFRLEVNAKFACKTLHKTSHLGGVLVKGELKMKIGDEEFYIKEGDMTLVPPLTNWEATNVGDCESVFYYWCGRFNS